MFDMLLESGHKPDFVTYSSIIDGFFLVNKVNEAAKLFDSMIKAGLAPSVQSYSIMINGYCKNKMVDQAITLFKEMRCKSLVPNIGALWMVSTTRAAAVMEARMDAMEKQIAELRAEFKADNQEMMRQIQVMFSQHMLPTHLSQNHSQTLNEGPIENQHQEQNAANEGAQNVRQGSVENTIPAPRRYEPNRKIDVPKFSGEDVCGWLIKIERYFRVI
ncbi:hypothetical protein PIB30_032342 [Stylosanthes scabra]|uniref:Pentatricopeptide repeat-containing protein n=1 Tax=Stylosanthes scabra TaxID=79078 RepID=A0ABU6SCS0_9FABA|nr:hypothetical protein [Stylosanthes scabra]